MSVLELSGHVLDEELDILQEYLKKKLSIFLEKEEYIPVSDLKNCINFTNENHFHFFIEQNNLNIDEKLIILLSIAPLLRPGMLEILQVKNRVNEKIHSEFGGVIGEKFHGMLPTIETAIFLLADKNNIESRLNIINLFDQENKLRKLNIIELSDSILHDPLTTRIIKPTHEFIHEIVWKKTYHPEFSTSFPASKLETRLEWDDVVLDHNTLENIEEISLWMEHKDYLLKEVGLIKKIKQGYRSLFYGPPGTGKSLTAAMLGKMHNKDVYRIDLSMVVSKYIGETEKNLAGIFDQAENKDWILFFDEADSLFGKRTATKDSKDRYANQEISYLLQRIEDFPGVIILATNLKANIDDAFMRRFQSTVYFPMPNIEMRLQLWQNAFDINLPREKDVDLKQIAKDYEISGGSIINVLRYCALKAVGRPSKMICLRDIQEGIRKEFQKVGKIA